MGQKSINYKGSRPMLLNSLKNWRTPCTSTFINKQKNWRYDTVANGYNKLLYTVVFNFIFIIIVNLLICIISMIMSKISSFKVILLTAACDISVSCLRASVSLSFLPQFIVESWVRCMYPTIGYRLCWTFLSGSLPFSRYVNVYEAYCCLFIFGK